MDDDTRSQNMVTEELQNKPETTTGGGFRSLKDLLDRVTGRGLQPPGAVEESGIAESLPFPFLRSLVNEK